jgi:hypothetical protein
VDGTYSDERAWCFEVKVVPAAQKKALHLFQFALRSRCTAMLAGLRTLIQTEHRPDRYVPSIFFETMPSA